MRKDVVVKCDQQKTRQTQSAPHFKNQPSSTHHSARHRSRSPHPSSCHIRMCSHTCVYALPQPQQLPPPLRSPTSPGFGSIAPALPKSCSKFSPARPRAAGCGDYDGRVHIVPPAPLLYNNKRTLYMYATHVWLWLSFCQLPTRRNPAAREPTHENLTISLARQSTVVTPETLSVCVSVGRSVACTRLCDVCSSLTFSYNTHTHPRTHTSSHAYTHPTKRYKLATIHSRDAATWSGSAGSAAARTAVVPSRASA